jgi:hypothetical protein
VTGGASEWFVWQSPTNGTAIVTTDGSNFDTVLAIYIGPGDSYSTLTNVACDNDSGANGKTSRVMFPARAGTIYYIAVDGVNGASGTVKLNYNVGAAPEIITQPISRTVLPSTSVTLSAAANGFPALRYQWSFKGTNIAGATNASVTLTNVSEANLGTYQLRVTNAIGIASSAPAVVLLEQSLRFSAPRRDASGLSITGQCPAGMTCLVERSTNLSVWSPVFTNRTQTGSFTFPEASVPTNGCYFYRMRLVL